MSVADALGGDAQLPGDAVSGGAGGDRLGGVRPPLMRLSGHSDSQLAKCLAVGKGVVVAVQDVIDARL